MTKIQADLYRYTGNKNSSIFWNFFKIRAFRYQYYYRMSCKKNNFFIKIILKILSHRIISKYGFILETTDQIGPGLMVLSTSLLGVNAGSKVGKNCTLSQGVYLGVANRGKLKGCPKLGDNVWIGPYSMIVGNIKIGNNVWIGPNSYINIDIPDNSRVFGNPPQIIPDESAVKDYIINPIE
ncbi:serine acetyltransferase [Apibacter muscae]|uniref:Serine acetyltransferase n=1 Tax=Apibacter muscae TaxID=2509004 RepID=A0A563DHF5_9FLAO|nr:DapH/DapD/GlmU-related protein [Apibacter muscae]TWP29283.1 serine acetyltransferase [Apibacter muscae]TWP31097.1 serine acetyltransferase [Apibacter muscae]